MRRRELLTGLGASAFTFARSAHAANMQNAPGADLSAIVAINGRKFEFHATAGQDLGDFRGQSFIQRCIRVTRPDTPLTVFFRPDRTSDRVEVVFRLGRIWGAANRAALHIGAYRALIKRGDRVLAAVDVPQHWWFSRWRWQSSPRPVIRTPGELIDAKLIMPYSREIARIAGPLDTSNIVYRGPMDGAGIMPDMGSTGERPEIGPTTEYQAAYIMSEDEG